MRRLGADDLSLARETFAMMVTVFEEEDALPLSDGYLHELLCRESFWAMAAVLDGQVLGGLTAYALPMTRSPSAELFIYDLAIRPEHQRTGIGARLVGLLCSQAAAAGVTTVFVPADNDDTHALDFYRAQGGESAPVTIFTFTHDPHRVDGSLRASAYPS